MPETVAPRSPSISRPLMLAGAVVALALMGTVMLWAHYGATVSAIGKGIRLIP